MATAKQMYALGIDGIVNLIKNNGHQQTVLVEGHMGVGKSSILTILAKMLPSHTPCYFDCTTKDLGDITIPKLNRLEGGDDFVRYATNEELGLHLKDSPIILDLDEYAFQ